MFLSALFKKKKRNDSAENENTPEKLRETALDENRSDEDRASAVKKLMDPKICETILMSHSSTWSTNWKVGKDRYFAAAAVLFELGEQEKLEQIYRQCPDAATKAIVIEQIKNLSLMEEAATDNETIIAKNAISHIHDEAILARVAIRSNNKLIDPVKEIRDETLLQDIALHASVIDIRIDAISKMQHPEAITEQLKAEVFPRIISNPWDKSIKLLAQSGESTARIIQFCSSDDTTINLTDEDYQKADHQVLYTILKRFLNNYLGSCSCENRELVPAVASVIRYMHDNGIMTKEIEADLPQTVTYSYCYNYWTNEEERYKGDSDIEKTVTLWSPE